MAKKSTIAAVSLAGMAGLAVAGQFAPLPPGRSGKPLPIPDLPKVEIAPSIDAFPKLVEPVSKPEIPDLPDPKPLPVPPIVPIQNLPQAPQPLFLPEIAAPVQLNGPEFRLQTIPAGNSFNGEASREQILALPAAVNSTTMSPREEVSMPIDRKSILAAAIGTALSVNAAFSDEPKKEIPLATDDGKKTEKVEKLVVPPVDVKKELDDVKALLDALTTRQKELNKVVIDSSVTKKVDDLATSIKALEEQVKKLDDKVTKVNDNLDKVRTSFSSPVTREQKMPEVSKEGIVKLVNNYGDSLTLILNGKPVKLAVGETKDVKVPVGTFEYALPLAGGEVKSSQVKDNEIVTLKIK